jgi:hypothetical protein
VANGSVVHTYGWHTISLHLGLRRDFTWRFHVADVTKPIIGVDFLSHFNLLVDTRNQRLVDGITSLTTVASVYKRPSQSVKAMSSDANVYPLLAEYPELTRPSGVQRDIKHSTVHHIRTTPGPPVNSRPRRLDPERLALGKASSVPCSTTVPCAASRARGHRHCTWCLRRTMAVDRAVTKEPSTLALPQTATQYGLLEISHTNYPVAQFSLRSIWSRPTTRFLSTLSTSQRQQSQLIRTFRISLHVVWSSQCSADLPTLY